MAKNIPAGTTVGAPPSPTGPRGKIQATQPVKYIAGLLVPGPEELAALRGELELLGGPIDLEAPLIPFSFTDYYQREMGPLMRTFVAFETLRSPGELASFKIAANTIEDRRRREDGRRRVNIDPGYLGLPQLVLASTKHFAHRIYLDRGIYAEVTLVFQERSFQSLPWTYPDYQAHIPLFNAWRGRLRTQLKELEAAGETGNYGPAASRQP